MPIIVLRRDAEADLESIDAFSRERFGGAVTDDYMAGFAAAFVRLTEFPEIGAVFRSRRQSIRSLRAGNHRIFYYFDGRRVVIVRVLHQAMNAARCVKV